MFENLYHFCSLGVCRELDFILILKRNLKRFGASHQQPRIESSLIAHPLRLQMVLAHWPCMRMMWWWAACRELLISMYLSFSSSATLLGWEPCVILPMHPHSVLVPVCPLWMGATCPKLGCSLCHPRADEPIAGCRIAPWGGLHPTHAVQCDIQYSANELVCSVTSHGHKPDFRRFVGIGCQMGLAGPLAPLVNGHCCWWIPRHLCVQHTNLHG